MGVAQSIHGRREAGDAITGDGAAAESLEAPESGSSSDSISSDGDGDRVEATDLTTRLTDDCLELVFERLPLKDRRSCSLVCQRWLRAEAQSRQLLLLSASANLPPNLPDLLHRFEHITKLALRCDRNSASIDDEGLLVVGRFAPQLERIKLKGCKQITDQGLEDFSRLCPSLRKLSCGTCGFGARGLDAILANCELLKDLSVKRLKNLFQEPDGSVRSGAGKLRRLCLKDLANAHVFQPLIAGSTQLQTLILARLSGDWDEILAASMQGKQRHCLAELRMEKIQVGDAGLAAVASSCKALEVLYLVKCPLCTNAGLSALAHGCRIIRKLHLDGCFVGRIGDEGLSAIGQRCPELQELVLIRLNVTSASLALLGLSLERLAICNSESFGDAELSCVVLRCRELKKLCIKSCPISDAGLEAIAAGCPVLVKVKVKKCRGVSALGASMLQSAREAVVVVVDSPAVAVVMDLERRRGGPPALASRPPRPSVAKTRFSFLTGPSNFVAGTLRRMSTPS